MKVADVFLTSLIIILFKILNKCGKVQNYMEKCGKVRESAEKCGKVRESAGKCGEVRESAKFLT